MGGNMGAGKCSWGEMLGGLGEMAKEGGDGW